MHNRKRKYISFKPSEGLVLSLAKNLHISKAKAEEFSCRYVSQGWRYGRDGRKIVGVKQVEQLLLSFVENSEQSNTKAGGLATRYRYR